MVTYEINIEWNNSTVKWLKDEKYHFAVMKNGGNHYGRSSWAKDREEVIREVKKQIERWEGMDYILHRMGDKVTRKNLIYTDDTKTIGLSEILENTRGLEIYF